MRPVAAPPVLSQGSSDVVLEWVRLMRFIPASFRSRLALLFGGLALLVGLPVYLYIVHVYAAQMVADRGRAMHDLAVAVAATFAENLHERQREIDLLAQTPLYQRESFTSADFTASVESLQKSYPHYSWIGVADTQGIVRASTGNLLLGQSVSQRPWFTQGLQRSFIGDLHEAQLLSKLLPSSGNQRLVRFIDFAAPILDAQGNPRGVLAAHAYWRWAGDVAQVMVPQSAAEQGLEVFIVNGAKQIIYPEGDAESMQVPEAIFSGQPFVQTTWGDAQTYVTAMVGVRELASEQPLYWCIVVRQPTVQTLADVAALQRIVIMFALASVLVFLILAWWSASLVSRPIERLVVLARRIEQGENPAFDVRSSTLEVRHLVEALRSMASSLLSREQALTESNLRLERKVAERTAELAKVNAELLQQTRRDALTGLANRHAANQRLREEFLRMQRSHIPYAVLMMDIDFFKQVNDSFGHAVGDEVLQHVAVVISGSVRATDFVARYGGEEFFALLPATTLHEAQQVAEKVRQTLASAMLPSIGAITLSIGVAVADVAQVAEDVAVLEADGYLYQAKHSGRNRVASASNVRPLQA